MRAPIYLTGVVLLAFGSQVRADTFIWNGQNDLLTNNRWGSSDNWLTAGGGAASRSPGGNGHTEDNAELGSSLSPYNYSSVLIFDAPFTINDLTANHYVSSGPPPVDVADWTLKIGNGSLGSLTTASITVKPGASLAVQGNLLGVGEIKGGGTVTIQAIPSPSSVPQINGSTAIKEGTTVVLGSDWNTTAQTAAVAVNGGATIAGEGTIHGTLDIQGTVAPGTGSGKGTLTTSGAQTWGSGGIYELSLTGLSDTDSDMLEMSSVTVDNGFTVKPSAQTLLAFAPTESYQWSIAHTTESDDFGLADLHLDTSSLTSYGGTWWLSEVTGGPKGGGTTLLLSYSAVPEATTTLLGAMAVMPLLAHRRRRPRRHRTRK